MAEENVPAEANGKARFHFDPRYHPNHAPTIEAFIGWLRAGMRGAHGESLPNAVLQYGRLRAPLAFFGWLSTLLPAGRRKAKLRAEDACIAAAMPEITRMHDLMREFGADLTTGRFAHTIQSMMSIAMMDRMLDEAISRLTPDRRPETDGLTTEDRIGSGWDAMRADLESEALIGLFDGVTPRTEWPRLIAALRSSREEIRAEKLNEQIGILIKDLEEAASRRLEGR